ncbi:MAG TPA: hypothetical protein VHT03_07470 [Rhizomicrobium sp.]|jgi:hypothetical protein|nr:hypothetical protein [Rhizomicrobium sp.]
MIRVLNFVSFALAALCCLALYHLSEETRVARIRLLSVERRIAEDHDAMKVLQADWERVSEPSRIHALAQAHLGLSDSATVAVASFDLLPRRGDAPPLAGSPVQTASMAANVTLSDPHIRLAAAHAGN